MIYDRDKFSSRIRCKSRVHQVFLCMVISVRFELTHALKEIIQAEARDIKFPSHTPNGRGGGQVLWVILKWPQKFPKRLIFWHSSLNILITLFWTFQYLAFVIKQAMCFREARICLASIKGESPLECRNIVHKTI